MRRLSEITWLRHHWEKYPLRSTLVKGRDQAVRVDQDVGTMVPQPSLFEIASSSGASRHPARGDQILIGRSPDNDIVLSNEPTVSRRHAELLRQGDAWAVRDIGSHNGTYVNGVRVADGHTHPITPADVVGIGNVTVRLLPGVVFDC